MKLTASEKDVQKAILQWLRLHGAFAVRVNTGAVKVGKRLVRFNDTTGCPDILCCVPLPRGGRSVFVGIEVKAKGGKLRPAQAAVLDAINRAGGVAFVADGIEAVERALRAEGLID